MFPKKKANAFNNDGDDSAPRAMPGRMAPSGGMTGPDAPHMAQPPYPRGPSMGAGNLAGPVQTNPQGGRAIPPPMPPAGHPGAPPLAHHVANGGRCPHCGLRKA